MKVMEIYRSVQGEGILAGVPATFVRFFACNLRCVWCDTKYSWSSRQGGSWRWLAPGHVAEAVTALRTRHVVLTGGEPTLEKELAALARLLHCRDRHLTVETNTTVYAAGLLPYVDLWSFSPKLPSAGEGCLRHSVIQQYLATVRSDRQQWKFVVRDDADERCLRGLLERYPMFRRQRLPIVLQPEASAAEGDYAAALARLAQRLKEPFWDPYFVRVLPQMHVMIWGRRPLV